MQGALKILANPSQSARGLWDQGARTCSQFIADIEREPRKLFAIEKAVTEKLNPHRFVIGRLLVGEQAEIGR